jgi:hypothetical protein
VRGVMPEKRAWILKRKVSPTRESDYFKIT